MAGGWTGPGASGGRGLFGVRRRPAAPGQQDQIVRGREHQPWGAQAAHSEGTSQPWKVTAPLAAKPRLQGMAEPEVLAGEDREL